MSYDVILYGVPQSSYVRTARMVLEAKGVSYLNEPMLFGPPEKHEEIAANATFSGEPVAMGSPEHRALHPFCKIPILKHGDFVVHETWAIASYVDEVFDGRPLQPSDPRGRAQVRSFVSKVVDYLYPAVVSKRTAGQSDAPPAPEVTADQYVPFAKPSIPYALSVLNDALDGKQFLVGDQDTLADYFLLPIMYYMVNSPEGGALVGSMKHLASWYERASNTPEARATTHPIPG